MMQVNLPAICRRIYPRCDSRLPAIAGNSAWNCKFFVRVFFPAFAVIFVCVWQVFLPAILVFLPVSCMYFCLQKQAILHASRGQICMSSACKTTCKMPVVFRQFACVLREVLAASKQVNLPVFTGKLHVTQVNCARDLFTCELQVKLPAFAGNFARASFTVFD